MEPANPAGNEKAKTVPLVTQMGFHPGPGHRITLISVVDITHQKRAQNQTMLHASKATFQISINQKNRKTPGYLEK